MAEGLRASFSAVVIFAMLALSTSAVEPGDPPPAIADLDKIERDLAQLEKGRDARDLQRDKSDLPEAAARKLSGRIQASDTVAIQRVRRWKEGNRPYGLSFTGPGLVRLDLPRQEAIEVKSPRARKDGVFFVTFTIRPALSPDPDKWTYLNVAGAMLAFSVEPPTMGIRAGRFFVLNGGARSARQADWVNGRVSFPVNERFETAVPLDFMLRIDQEQGEWDLYFRGNLRYAGIFYRGPNRGIWLRSAGEGTSELAELDLTSFNPLFEDNDVDGIDDAVERELGFSPEVNDRSALDELGQFSNLQHFVNRRMRYPLRREIELEATLVEAIAAHEAGRDPVELADRKIPPEARPHHFTREDWEQIKAEARARNRKLPEIARPRGIQQSEGGMP